MGISDRMSQFAGNVQSGVKRSSSSLLNTTLKVITALVLGLVFALVGSELFHYGQFLFTFVLLVVAGVTFRVVRNFSLGQVLLFDLFCVLVGLVLRMYILIAP